MMLQIMSGKTIPTELVILEYITSLTL